MSKRSTIWITAFVTLLLLIAIAAWLLLPNPIGVVVIDVSAPAGTKFQGSCEVDGNTRDLVGPAPATFTVEGHKIVYTIKPADSAGGLTVKVDIGGRASGSVSSGNPPQGIHGWARFGRFSRSHWIESFDPKIPERWMTSPP
jgi:hypothetical protein